MSLSAQQLAAQKNISGYWPKSSPKKILTGEYQPESILPGEMELGEQFGVSRTAVREAVKTLLLQKACCCPALALAPG